VIGHHREVYEGIMLKFFKLCRGVLQAGGIVCIKIKEESVGTFNITAMTKSGKRNIFPQRDGDLKQIANCNWTKMNNLKFITSYMNHFDV
jgi:hypothetical protein